MLLLYELPRLAPSFGGHSPLHAATAALRILAQHHAKQLAKLLSAALDSRLNIMDSEARVSNFYSVLLSSDLLWGHVLSSAIQGRCGHASRGCQ